MSYYNILNVDSLSSMHDIEVAYEKKKIQQHYQMKIKRY